MKISKMLFYLIQPLFHIVFVSLMLSAIFTSDTIQYKFNFASDILGVLGIIGVIGFTVYQLVKGPSKEIMLLKNGSSFMLALVEVMYIFVYIDFITNAAIVIIFFSVVFSLLVTAMYVEENEFIQPEKSKQKRSRRRQKEVVETKITIYLKSLLRSSMFFVLLQAIFIAYVYVLFGFLA